MSTNQQVPYVAPTLLLASTSKSSSFNSDQFPVNNNPNIQITLHVTTVSGVSCTAKIQGSLDGSTWLDLDSTSATISANDDVLWTLSQIDSLMYIRVAVTFVSGSAIMSILYRGC